jgi:magnesium chelatase subunit D
VTPGGFSRALPDADIATVALLVAVDPHGLGGVVLRGMPGPTRDAFLETVYALQHADAPAMRVPVNVGHDRLLGGLDFAATMATGKPVFASGLLESANDGLLVLAMAERLAPAAAAIVASALDSAEIVIERDGITDRRPSRFGVIALDEGIDDEAVSPVIADRLAFTVQTEECTPLDVSIMPWSIRHVADARRRLAGTEVDESALDILTRSAAAFGIDSLRAVLFAVRAARAAAALLDKPVAEEAELALAARLVYPQRARMLPGEPEQPPEQEESAAEETPEDSDRTNPHDESRMPDDVLVDAVKAEIPPGLLEMLARQQRSRRQQSAGSRGGPKTRSKTRGRPVGSHPGEVGEGNRLNVLSTLKAAAPWQAIRRADAVDDERALQIRKEDIHVNRYEDRVETTTIFAVDASGSQAAQRLAEVKGAIELLLNDCYVRRDQVALIAFRGKKAESLLPPTRALARVKKTLRALPGGGGTPLALGLDAARELALSEYRHGRNATIVVLTDGRANIARNGDPAAATAEADALESGRLIRANGIRALLVDTSRRPRPRARELANAMDAIYVPMPYADARGISETVQRNVGS